MGKKFRFHPFTNGKNPAIMSRLCSKCTGGSMDRASDSGSEGWGFESLPVYQSNIIRTISSKSEAGSDYLFISQKPHNRNKGCRFGNPCLFICFPFRKPPLKIGLNLWLCIIGSYIIEHAASEPLNGILRNIGLVDKLFLSSHINGTLS